MPLTLYTRTHSGRYKEASPDQIQDAFAQYLVPPDSETLLIHPRATRDYLRSRLVGYQQERMYVLFLSSRNAVIDLEEMTKGTIDGASCYPREIVRLSLHHNAAGAILAHNHPSGNPEPSQADRSVTRRVMEALALVDVRLLDHIVVGRNGTVSMAERGML